MRLLVAAFLLSLATGARAQERLLRVLKGHTDKVANVAFSPDGKNLFSVSDDESIRRWDIASGQTTAVYHGPDGEVYGMVYFSHPAYGVTGDTTFKLYEIASAKRLATFSGHATEGRTFSLSPDGKTAASTSWDGELKLWDAQTGEELAVLHHPGNSVINDIYFSPDGGRLAAARGDKSLILWDVPKRKRLGAWRGHKNEAMSVAFSPDGRYLLSGGRDNVVRLWDAESGETLAVLRGHKSYVYRVAFSPDGTYALTGGADYTLRKWEIPGGKPLGVFWGHQGGILDIAISPDARLAATASEDHTLRLWDMREERMGEQTAASEPDTQFPPPFEKAELGRMLFFDQRLSGDNSRDCATCHIPAKAYADGRDLSLGYPDTLYFRNTPSLYNASIKEALYWDGRFPSSDMASLIRDHISEAHFMSADGRLIVEKLRQAPGYVRAFRQVYGGEPDYGKVLDALAAFVASIKSGESAYARHRRGDASALSPSAARGLALFNGAAGCARCHSGPLFTDGKAHARGIAENPKVFSDPLRHISFRRFFKLFGVGGYASLREDLGRFALTRSDGDKKAFQTPSLLEVSRTAPYMHNGMIASLEEAVAFENPKLDKKESRDLVEFLKSLSSPVPVAEPPALPEYALISNTTAGPVLAALDGDAEQSAGTADLSRVPRTLAGVYRGIAIDQPFAPDKQFPPLGPLPPVPVPQDNPLTLEKIELGRLLFFDHRLSGNGDNYCAACHESAMGWGDNSDLALGYTETLHWRNSQTLLNAAYYAKLNWDGSAASLEEQARIAITSNLSQNGDPAMIEERLAQSPSYVALFKRAFGVERPHFEGVLKALASFQRAVPVSAKSPLDRYFLGEKDALSPAAERGFSLFNGKAGCIRCHNGPLASDQSFHATGVPRNPAFDNVALRQVALRYKHVAAGVPEEVYRAASDDPGIFLATRRPQDIGKFRTPSLRELKYTAPYMHNGIFDTLEEVLEFYDKGAGAVPGKDPLLKPLSLSAAEKKDLIAFLEALSGEEIVIERPKLVDPYFSAEEAPR